MARHKEKITGIANTATTPTMSHMYHRFTATHR